MTVPTPVCVDHTCEVVAGSDEFDPEADDRQAALREEIRSCDQRLERYRALLDEGEAVATVAKWIAEVERERKAAQAQLGREVPGGKLTKSQVSGVPWHIYGTPRAARRRPRVSVSLGALR